MFAWAIPVDNKYFNKSRGNLQSFRGIILVGHTGILQRGVEGSRLRIRQVKASRSKSLNTVFTQRTHKFPLNSGMKKRATLWDLIWI